MIITEASISICSVQRINFAIQEPDTYQLPKDHTAVRR